MAYSKKAEMFNGVKGGFIEFGQISLDPASIAANAQGVETIAVPGAKTGDIVFVNVQALPASISMAGAKVTATDVVSIYFNNTIDSTTAVDIAAKTVDVMLIHLS